MIIFHKRKVNQTTNHKGRRGHYWYPKFYYNVIVFVGYKTLVTLLNLIGCFQNDSVKTFKPII